MYETTAYMKTHHPKVLRKAEKLLKQRLRRQGAVPPVLLEAVLLLRYPYRGPGNLPQLSFEEAEELVRVFNLVPVVRELP